MLRKHRKLRLDLIGHIIGVMVLFTTTYKLLGCITTVLCVTRWHTDHHLRGQVHHKQKL